MSDIIGNTLEITKTGLQIAKGFLDPHFIRWKADAELYHTETQIQIAKMKADNLNEISKKTKEDLGRDISDEDNIDKDWILKYINIAENISDEEMQNIFAKLLAEEIEKPKSYSIRTVRILESMTGEEARSFIKLSAYVIESQRRYMVDIFIDESKIKFDELMTLEMCGLINLTLSRKIITDENHVSILYNDLIGIIDIDKSKMPGEYTFNDAYLLTQSGIELYKLVKNMITTYDEPYFINFMKRKANTDKNIKVGIYKIQGMNSEGISYSPKNNLIL
jgi:hypothetical protein